MSYTSPLPWFAALAVAAIVFTLFPGLDLAVSGYFYNQHGFPFRTDAPVETVRRALYVAEDVAGVSAFLLAWRARTHGPILGQGTRAWLYQGLVFLLGPALLVNAVVKPIWARPRPDHIAAFGGADPFQPIWRIHGMCPGNCSFFSGEVSGATALTLMLLMLAQANRAALGRLFTPARALATLPLLYTFWQRIAAGRHFLSDAVFALLATALLATLLAHAMKMARSSDGC